MCTREECEYICVSLCFGVRAYLIQMIPVWVYVGGCLVFVSLCECASLWVCVCAHLGVGVSRVFLLRGRATLCPRSAGAGLACAASLPSSPWRPVVQGAPQVPIDWDQVATGSWLFREGTRLGFGLCHFLLCDLGPVSWLLWSLLLHLPEERDAAAHLRRLGDWAQGNAWVWRGR